MARSSMRILSFDDEHSPAPEPSASAAAGEESVSGVEAGLVRRRVRWWAGAAVGVVVVGVLVGVQAWRARVDAALVAGQVGGVVDLSGPPVARSSVGIDALGSVQWLGGELMVSREGGLVGLDPASGVQRWRVEVEAAECAGGVSAWGCWRRSMR